MFTFSLRSKINLAGCDGKLQLLFNEVIKHRDCTIICGYRDQEAQEEAFRTGYSKARWGQSAHNVSPSRAADVMPYPIDWNDIHGINRFAGFVFGIASQLKINIKWGGDFKGFFDGAHFELEDD